MKIVEIKVKPMKLGVTIGSAKRKKEKFITGEVYFEGKNDHNTFILKEDIKDYQGYGIGIDMFIIATVKKYYIFTEDCKLENELSRDIGKLIQMVEDGFIIQKDKTISKYDNNGNFVEKRKLTEQELEDLKE